MVWKIISDQSTSVILDFISEQQSDTPCSFSFLFSLKRSLFLDASTDLSILQMWPIIHENQTIHCNTIYIRKGSKQLCQFKLNRDNLYSNETWNCQTECHLVVGAQYMQQNLDFFMTHLTGEVDLIHVVFITVLLI